MNEVTGTPSTSNGANGRPSWFIAMAEAWGRALDRQADVIVDRSEGLGEGEDTPADVTILQAEAQRMQFMSNASHTAMTSVGTALDTIARRQ